MIVAVSRGLTTLMLTLLLVTAACTAPALGRSSPGTIHARVVSGSGGAHLLLVPVYFGSHGPYDFALDTGAARSLVDSRLATQLRLPTTGSEQAVTGISGTSEAARVRVT